MEKAGVRRWRKGYSLSLLAVACGVLVTALQAQERRLERDPLSYFFDGRRGQIEVGGRYVGLEFHHSRPAPSRISFYYPVANSIDFSSDYWKRDRSLPMAIGVRIGGGQVQWIYRESLSYILSPHKVTFVKEDGTLQWAITYEFCFNEPAAVATILVRNASRRSLSVELYAHLLLSLRTCQTYAWKDSSWGTFDRSMQAIAARFDDADTDSATVFVQNVGEQPAEWTLDADEVHATGDGSTKWPLLHRPLTSGGSAQPRKGRTLAAFVYRKVLGPSDSLKIVQILGSCREEEVQERTSRLRAQWSKETRAYDDYIREKAQGKARFVTGNGEIDRSAVWARALIAANAHYLHGTILPMPCPAEYNFFFTHDMLLTDLGAVNFDLPRVKRDLLYLVSAAKDSVIPHAYYWRDDGFKTEYCEPENWNHLWFILVSGSYLRHSLDDSTGRVLFPFLQKSVRELLTRLRSDGLMYAYRPDWWDIGHIEGPRSYLTALTARALREYLFISSYLHTQSGELLEYERRAETMQRALVDRLWGEKDEYLMNYNEGTKDYHFYAGSLIAPVYGLLDGAHALKLVATAGRQLLDERIGLRIAVPVDFSSDSVIRKFKFADGEAGPPYSYANGGVWPHGNAWYALALKNVGKLDESYRLVQRTMTIDGVAHSPNGLPAMYEYRSSDPNSPAFGTIDKPSFLWAGGMYLQVLYCLLAIDENEWNIALRDELPSQCDSVSCSLSFGDLKEVTVRRAAAGHEVLVADGEEVPSRVLPLDLRGKHRWESVGGRFEVPVLVSASALVHSVEYDPGNGRFRCVVSSFDGHRTRLTVESKEPPQRILIDGAPGHGSVVPSQRAALREVTVEFPGSEQRQEIIFEF